MAVQPQYLAYILEQLEALGSLHSRRMFGGVGLYRGELFFGLIDDDTLFLKVDETNSAQYQARNMPRFMPPASRPLGPMGYYQVPADIIEESELLVSWARQSVEVALRKAKKPVASKPAAKKKRAKKPRRRIAPRKGR
jgi:DNA transformation protein